jgi:hypothetical protein
MDTDAMQTSIGSATIQLAISKNDVIERAHRIVANFDNRKSGNTRCQRAYVLTEERLSALRDCRFNCRKHLCNPLFTKQ